MGTLSSLTITLEKKISKQKFISKIVNHIVSCYEKDNKRYAVVDEITLKFLKGATVDFENVMIRAGFVVLEISMATYLI